MSKSNKLPKALRMDKQGDLFAHTYAAGTKPDGGTSRKDLRAAMFSRLEEQRTLTTNIVDNISAYGSIGKAFQQVKRNDGAAGTDGITVAEYERELSANIRKLHTELRNGTYRPSAVRRVETSKPNGGIRELGIPTIADRTVQQSILMSLQRVYDPYFSKHSYGFRPGRSAQQAVEQASKYVSEGKIWVVDIDLESFFDKINHDRLMSRLRKSITDKRLLKLIHQFLQAGMMHGGLETQRIAGTPQGGPLSPLLSNIVLDELDWELEARGLSFVRYADDSNIFVSSQRSAERVMRSLIDYIEGELKLKVNRQKSGVRKCDQVKFLGHTIEENGKIRIADGSIVRFKEKIRVATKRNRALPLRKVLQEVNRIIEGWAVYFRKCNTWLSELRELDGWIRNRLRCYALKQHKKKYPTFRFLRSIGVAKQKAWYAVRFYAWWPMANLPYVRNGMGILWFARMNLRSLVAVQRGKR